SHDRIRVHGARENNLKDVSVELPKRRLRVFTAVSGFGQELTRVRRSPVVIRRNSSFPSRLSRRSPLRRCSPSSSSPILIASIVPDVFLQPGVSDRNVKAVAVPAAYRDRLRPTALMAVLAPFTATGRTPPSGLVERRDGPAFFEERQVFLKNARPERPGRRRVVGGLANRASRSTCSSESNGRHRDQTAVSTTASFPNFSSSAKYASPSLEPVSISDRSHHSDSASALATASRRRQP